MKKIFSTQHSAGADAALLLARIVIASMMLTHGIPKLGMLFSGDPIQFPPVMGMSAVTSLFLAVFAEVACSILILFGLGTRLATIPGIITMLVALVAIHGADPFEKKENALHYLLVYVVLLLAGAGKYSLDTIIQDRLRLSIRRRNSGKAAVIPA
jgi:putative oxidoreductase